MEFKQFKIKAIHKLTFEGTFLEILKDGKIPCNQWEFQHGDGHTIVEIPMYAVDKMTTEQIALLNEFVIE
jgi:hypothetical protein